MRYSGYKINKETRRSKVDVRERMRYGVSRVDTWGFDNYLLNVLTNGLAMLARDAHGWPSGEEYPEFDDWIKALQQASDDAYWCLVTYDDETTKVHRKYYTKRLEDFDDLIDYLNDQIPEDQYKLYRAEYDALTEERDMRKDRLLDFVKENFFALWD